VSPEENVALFEAIKAQAEGAAVPAVEGMAEHFEGDVRRVLSLTAHGPMPSGAPHYRAFGVYYEATPGAPPALASGDLLASMMRRPASGGIVATAMVGNTAIYSAVQEWGATLRPNSAYLHWLNTRGSWFKRSVTVPAHPYFRKALETDIADGSLTGAAMAGWEAHMTLLD
jgi:phage gpG-like protein